MTAAEISAVTDPHLLFSGSAPAPATPTNVFLLKTKLLRDDTDPGAYVLIGEYKHTADVFTYKALPAGEDILMTFTNAPGTLEYYSVPAVSKDGKTVGTVQFERIQNVQAVRLSTGQAIRAYRTTITQMYYFVGKNPWQNFTPIVAAPSPLMDASGGGMPPAPTVMDASGAAVPISVDTISHVPAPTMTTASAKSKVIGKLKKKLAAATPVKSVGELSPFVARQLLELAQMRKELCPIVAEEFSTGNTAVMPCGHLFAQIAIEESFKKEPNRCPACRQGGRPTYV